MNSPGIVIKSGYIDSVEYFFNSLEYSGNKIDKQVIIYDDGSRREVSTDQRIVLSDGEQQSTGI